DYFMVHVLTKLVGSSASAIGNVCDHVARPQIDDLDRTGGNDRTGAPETVRTGSAAAKNGSIRCADLALVDDDHAVRSLRVGRARDDAHERRRCRALMDHGIAVGVDDIDRLVGAIGQDEGMYVRIDEGDVERSKTVVVLDRYDCFE